MIKHVLIAGGGTGGHLFPGIALVEELRRRQPEVKVLFVGTEKGIEARLLPKLGEQVVFIRVAPLMGRSPADLARSMALLPLAVGRSWRILRAFKPDLAIGLGGYAAGPVLAAAKLSGVAVALLEQNASLGLTNRWLAPWVGRAYLTHESTASYFRPGRALVCGNPVRRAFVEAARIAATDPAGVEARARNILIIGGSQGARVLNQVVPEALAEVGMAGRGFQVVHQTGAAMLDEVRGRYRKKSLEAEVLPFIEDMARAYSSAALVISRAGASALSEMCAIGRPSILIPYPFAAEGHQERNAAALERAGAAIVMREQEVDAAGMARQVRQILDDVGRRRAMSEAARGQGRPEAAAMIVDDLYAWLGAPDGSGRDSDRGPAVEGNTSGPGPGSGADGEKGAGRRPNQLRLRDKDDPDAAVVDAITGL